MEASIVYRKAAQGVGGSYIPHIQANMYGRKMDGTQGWLHAFNSPRLRVLNGVWAKREPWVDQARLARLQARVERWAKRHGHEIVDVEVEFSEEYPVHEWYLDVV